MKYRAALDESLARLLRRSRVPFIQVRAEETANGARLVFTPEQATDLDALREHIEKRSKHMEKGDCARKPE